MQWMMGILFENISVLIDSIQRYEKLYRMQFDSTIWEIINSCDPDCSVELNWVAEVERGYYGGRRPVFSPGRPECIVLCVRGPEVMWTRENCVQFEHLKKLSECSIEYYEGIEKMSTSNISILSKCR